MPNLNDTLFTLSKNVLLCYQLIYESNSNIIVPIRFFICSKLIVLMSSLSSAGSRNIEEETLLVKHRVTLRLLLFSGFPARRLPICKKNY